MINNVSQVYIATHTQTSFSTLYKNAILKINDLQFNVIHFFANDFICSNHGNHIMSLFFRRRVIYNLGKTIDT